MSDGVSIQLAGIQKHMRAEAVRLENEDRSLIGLGRGLDIARMLSFESADFVKVAYGMVFDRNPTRVEFLNGVDELGNDVPKLEFLRAIRFSSEGRRTSNPANRYALWKLQLRHIIKTAFAKVQASTKSDRQSLVE